MFSEAQRRLLALCAIRVGTKSVDWSLIARQAQADPSMAGLYAGQITETSADAETSRPILTAGLEHLDEAEERAGAELAAALKVGARLTTVLDDDYPANLRLVHDLPPFLFYRGEMQLSDVRSVAVVGTRDATDAGIRRARKMASLLVERGVTVVSGLARGIDTAAHQTALDHGGRTIAVLGTGITKCYPAENKNLADDITGAGAIVSQFWPSSGPAKWTFPRRNHVTSGISQGTVVIEASSTSGAKMQARLALEHHKRVFLVRTLVTDQKWARDYLKRGAIEVDDVEDVMRYLADPERVAAAARQRMQLTLDLA